MTAGEIGALNANDFVRPSATSSAFPSTRFPSGELEAARSGASAAPPAKRHTGRTTPTILITKRFRRTPPRRRRIARSPPYSPARQEGGGAARRRPLPFDRSCAYGETCWTTTSFEPTFTPSSVIDVDRSEQDASGLRDGACRHGAGAVHDEPLGCGAFASVTVTEPSPALAKMST